MELYSGEVRAVLYTIFLYLIQEEQMSVEHTNENTTEISM